ncbi:MAG: Rho termination factor N-terminal domain-containing protein [Desulfobacteraceae bacterium]|jgi:hypothetical protein
MAADKNKDAKEKPLERMTVKELKEVALQIPEITGVHGMNKQELVTEIQKARGIDITSKKSKSGSLKEVKKKINTLKAKRKAALKSEDGKMAGIYRRRISRLKKKTRRAA